MEHQRLTPEHAEYPKRLIERLGDDAPVIYAHGPLHLLNRFSMAVACSDLIPGMVFRATHDVLFSIREFAINYIGGWHSVMETEIFRLALHRESDPEGLRSLTMVSARGLARESWAGFLADRFGHEGPFTGFPEEEEYERRAQFGELLMLSITEPDLKRMTHKNIAERNWLACALADVIFIPYAEKGKKTYTLCKKALEFGLPVFTVEHEDNEGLTNLGVRTLNRKTVGPFMELLGAKRQAEPPFAAQKPLKYDWVPSQSKANKKVANQKQMGFWVKEDS